MNKLAADKIVQEYYDKGVKIALYASGIKTAVPDPYSTGIDPYIQPASEPNTKVKSEAISKPTYKPMDYKYKPEIQSSRIGSNIPITRSEREYRPTSIIAKPSPTTRSPYYDRYGSMDIMPGKQDYINLREYRESVARGVPDARLGNTDVFRGPNPISKFRLVAGTAETPPTLENAERDSRFMDSLMQQPFVARGQNSRPFMNLPDNKLGNNKITQAHEYYHANKPGGDQMDTFDQVSGNEHFADLFAGLSNYNLKDVAELDIAMNNLKGNDSMSTPVTHPKDDPHLDDQTRLRLLAGMAR